ncbi:unnamed protein product [Calicophoron daubneyi]|uniref:NADP-dependent oxidoreductase domain-containing protein n=1 Tax=Calicophoron daubneyi TaxID=300641 RepID=A0AAV2T5G3_CALDB
METVQFSDGRSIPKVGLGTWKAGPGEMLEAVKAALEAGYRHFDSAYCYGNQKALGEALEKCLKTMKIERKDIFVTAKVWCTYLRPDEVRKACEMELADLRLSYLDLYLIHWPICLKPGDDMWPKSEDGTLIVDKTPLVDTWKAMERLVDDGLVKSIGLSNFNRRQIDEIFENSRIKPVNLQIEIHANFPNTKLVDYAHSKGLTVTAYSPLGSPAASPGRTNPLTEPWVTGIAKKYGKTPAQVLLRWLVQRNIIVVPKSVTPSRIAENINIFDFALTPEEMKTISTSGINERQFKLLCFEVHPEYPFNDEF